MFAALARPLLEAPCGRRIGSTSYGSAGSSNVIRGKFHLQHVAWSQASAEFKRADQVKCGPAWGAEPVLRWAPRARWVIDR